MVGKRRLRLSNDEDLPQYSKTTEKEYCPLCGRAMIVGPTTDEHHLIPKSKGGVDKFRVHKVCHQKIHATLTETELARNYHTWQNLKAHPEIAKFLAWIKNKPIDYLDKNRKIKQRL